jgi:hypothetical protein
MFRTRDPRRITIDMAKMPLLTGQNPCLATPTVDQAGIDSGRELAASLPVLRPIDDSVVAALLNRPHPIPLPELRRHTRRLRPRTRTTQPPIQHLLTMPLAIPMMVRQDRLVTVAHPAQLHDLRHHPRTAQTHPVQQIAMDEVQAAARAAKRTLNDKTGFRRLNRCLTHMWV